MVAGWGPAVSTTATVYVYASSTAGPATVADCTCHHPAPGFACVAEPHATPDDRAAWEALKALERRSEFRDFVGHPPVPRAATPPRSRRNRAGGYRRDHHAWRTRALGKRPSPIASG